MKINLEDVVQNATMDDLSDPLLQIRRPNFEKTRGSVIGRLLPFLNFFISSLSITGGIYLIYEHSRTIKYLAIYDSYDRGVLLVASAICFVTGFVTFTGLCVIGDNLTETNQGSSRLMARAYIWWTVGLYPMHLSDIFLTYSALTKVSDTFKGGFYISMLQFEKNDEIQKKIDLLQTEMKCCGNRTFEEWFKISWNDRLQRDMLGIPVSCCNTKDFPLDDCMHVTHINQAVKLTPWLEGCSSKLEVAYSRILRNVVFIMSTMIALELVSFCFTLVSMHWMKKNSKPVATKRRHLMAPPRKN